MVLTNIFGSINVFHHDSIQTPHRKKFPRFCAAFPSAFPQRLGSVNSGTLAGEQSKETLWGFLGGGECPPG